MNCQPRVSLQSRAALLEAEMHIIMFRWTFISILPTREDCAVGVSEDDIGRGHSWDRKDEGSSVYMINCCRNAFANIPCWIRHAPVYVRSVFGLSVMHPVRILIVRYMFVCCLSLIRRHLACWTETMRYIFVTGTFQPFYVRCMCVRSFGFSTGLTLLPPDNKNSYPFHVRRFNPVKCDRGLTQFKRSIESHNTR